MQAIKKNSEFRRIYSEKHSIADSLLVLYTSPMRDAEPRVGISVSSKVGGAVVRNKTKRRIREILRNNPKALGFGKDAVFVARAKSAKAPFAALESSCLGLLARAARKSGYKGQ